MKHLLLLVGDELKTNLQFQQYILRAYKDSFFELSEIIFSSKTDPNLPLLLNKLTKEYEYLSIFASIESFTLINKLISTLSEDLLVLKDDMLLPSKVQTYQPNSYVMNLKDCSVNVLRVQEGEKLPNIIHFDKKQSSSFHIIGVDKESFDLLISSTKQAHEVQTTTTTLVDGWIKVDVYAKDFGNVNSFLQEINQLFFGKVFIGKDPFLHIVNSLQKHQKTISFAESCTGGLIASSITSISGSSEVFEGSLVTYSNRIKNIWLGVDNETLQSRGAVSEATIKQMLEGTLKASSSDFALAVSGIAGPNGGSKEKPVGTVFIGASNQQGEAYIERVQLKGDRKYIQMQTLFCAYKLLFNLAPKVFLENEF